MPDDIGLKYIRNPHFLDLEIKKFYSKKYRFYDIIFSKKEGVYMKKILCSLALATVILFDTTSVFAIDTQYYDIKPNGTQTVKRCPCKKHFENHLGLTKEQIKLVDTNRAAQQAELKPINTKIRENYKLIKETTDENEIAKLRAEIADLKAKSAEIKAEYNKKFESYLTEEQIKTLQYMREMKKEGKSCCPCGKNRYY